MRAGPASAATVLVVAALAGCGGGGGDGSPPPAPLTWHYSSLPVPDASRAAVRAAVWCGQRWWVAGATAAAHGQTRPAVWTSTDGMTWRTVRMRPGSDFYAAQAIVSSIACSSGRVAALSAKSGGAHGNPRVQTWRELSDRSLAAVQAPSEQYGGQDGVSVSRMSGGSSGFLLSGIRISGAAVWSSRTGAGFTLHENAPGLASTSSTSTLAQDAVRWEGSWTVVGDTTVPDGRLVATAWSGSGNGPWTGTQLPGGTQVTSGDRVTLTDQGPVVAGLDDTAFAVWAERDGHWAQTSTFGTQSAGSTSPAFVSGLAWTGGELVATYADGAGFRLAVGSMTSLSDVPLPTKVSDRGDHTATVAAHGRDVLLLTDDGHHSQVCLTHLR